jgi:hypothetical protein
MMALNAADTRMWWESPIHTVYELYVFVILLVGGGFCFGAQAVLLANDLGRTNPHHLHSEIFSLAVDVFLLVAMGVHVRRLVRRLMRAAQTN